MSNPRPKFGDRVRNIYASEANPIRDAIYVRRLKNLDEVTDGKGDFWRVGLGALILIASPNAEKCPECNGHGIIQTSDNGAMQIYDDCPKCAPKAEKTIFGFNVVEDVTIPDGEVRAVVGGKVVGKIVNLGSPKAATDTQDGVAKG